MELSIMERISLEVVNELKKNNISPVKVAAIIGREEVYVSNIFNKIKFSLDDLKKLILSTEIPVGLIILKHLINNNVDLSQPLLDAYINLQDSLRRNK